MSWRTNSVVLWARNVGRALGINRLVGGLTQHGYEVDYDTRLSSCVRGGDVVWDIGANVGYYTTQFAERVGPEGAVIAFEPSKLNFARLQAACEGLHQVSLQQFGLGDVRGQVGFRQGTDKLGATSQVVSDASGADVVEIRVGDELISAAILPQPNIIKMDVEGFEGEVLRGLHACLASPDLRAVGVEIHFGILKQRGWGLAPQVIESALRAAGFSVSWPDHSHLLATRRA